MQTNSSLTFSQILRVCEKVTRRTLLWKQLAGAKAFALAPTYVGTLCAFLPAHEKCGLAS